jgi:hypothetical protein
MKNLKKSIVLVLIALGFILLVADTDKGFAVLLGSKVIALAMLFGGIQLCASWKLYNDADND